MKELEKEFLGRGEVRGVLFRVLERSNDIVLLSRSDGYYEVCDVIKQQGKTTMMGGTEVVFEAKEYIGSGENWGGKCVLSEEKARCIFSSMVEAKQMRGALDE